MKSHADGGQCAISSKNASCYIYAECTIAQGNEVLYGAGCHKNVIGTERQTHTDTDESGK